VVDVWHAAAGNGGWLRIRVELGLADTYIKSNHFCGSDSDPNQSALSDRVL
jgi:hypothetical protein